MNKTIIFAGSSYFSCIILKNLIKNKINIENIIYPKKKNIINKYHTELINITEKNKIKIHEVKNLLNNKTINLIKKLNPHIIIVASYGAIFPNKILKIPKIGCINVHASLLPELRGASPVQESILKNYKNTGVTLILMNSKIDDGKIIYKNICTIKNNYSINNLMEILAHLASKILNKNIKNLINNHFYKYKQNKNLLSNTHKIKKKNGIINWYLSANQINKNIKAYLNWPSSFTFLKNKKIQIIETKIKIKKLFYKPGQIIKINTNGIYISTNNNIIIISKFKIEGKNIINAKITNQTKQFILGTYLKKYL